MKLGDIKSIERLAHNITQKMLSEGYIEEDELYPIVNDLVIYEIEERLESEEIEAMDLFARKCDHTGKGMCTGYIINSDDFVYLSEGQEDKLLELIKAAGYKGLEESYEAGYHYYTGWLFTMDELEMEREAFDENGNRYIFSGCNNNWERK